MTVGRLGVMPLISERVLVLVDGSAAAATAVRRAASLAGLLHGGLVAVVPEPSPTASGEEARNLREVAADAADLGADVIRVEADDLASAVARLAEARGATHVVIAHPPKAPGAASPPTPGRGAARPSAGRGSSRGEPGHRSDPDRDRG